MNLLTKLLGRKAETSENIGAEMEARRAALAKVQGTVAAAVQARARALDDLDAHGMAKADEAAAAGGRAVEIEERALALLADAHAKAVKAEQAAARASLVASFVERRAALDDRFSDWRRAAAIMADIMGEARTLARDLAEAGAEREVSRVPEVARFLPCIESVAVLSAFIDDALSGLPAVSESPKEASFREAEEARARRKAEVEEARRVRLEAEREEGRAAREAAEAKARERERNPYYPTWRDTPSDAAR